MDIIRSIIDSGRRARFEARDGAITGMYRVTYQYEDEHGIRYTFVDYRHRDDAETLALRINAELDAADMLAPYSHGMTF